VASLSAAPGQPWEYRVIHLNVEPPKPGRPETPPEAEASEPPIPFSRQYLAQEFPSHYTPLAAGKGQPHHPAQQLQIFLNRLGQERWEMVGINTIGSLSMIIFRRPLADPAAQAVDAESDASLTSILRRLERLEADRDPKARRRPTPVPGLSEFCDGQVVEPVLLERLADRAALSTPAAAAALGFRSAASLANLGNRSGYPPGLVKVGSNGRVALYRGAATASPRSQRLWVVLDADEIP
jgi:hypothetical protein